jgi:hypothetical protein
VDLQFNKVEDNAFLLRKTAPKLRTSHTAQHNNQVALIPNLTLRIYLIQQGHTSTHFSLDEKVLRRLPSVNKDRQSVCVSVQYHKIAMESRVRFCSRHHRAFRGATQPLLVQLYPIIWKR